jgi:hypothetical protein
VGSDKCPLGHILTYYEEHQPQYTHLHASMLAYAHINLLEILQRFGPNEVVRIATDSIYIRKDALYRIENVSAFFKPIKIKNQAGHPQDLADTSKFLCPHTSTACAFCSTKDPYTIRSIKEFQKIKMPLVRAGINKASECKHKPFVCEFCYGDWYYRQGFWKTSSLDATHLQETKKTG